MATLLSLVVALLLAAIPLRASAQLRFHGVQLGFGCFDGTGGEQISSGGVATCVGEVTNIDEYNDRMRIDRVGAVVSHTDGTEVSFAQLFPGVSTVDPGEAKQVIVLIKSKAGDSGEIIATVLVEGIDLGTTQPFSGSWQIGLAVLP